MTEEDVKVIAKTVAYEMLQEFSGKLAVFFKHHLPGFENLNDLSISELHVLHWYHKQITNKKKEQDLEQAKQLLEQNGYFVELTKE